MYKGYLGLKKRQRTFIGSQLIISYILSNITGYKKIFKKIFKDLLVDCDGKFLIYTNNVSSTENMRTIAHEAVEETKDMEGCVVSINGESYAKEKFHTIRKMNNQDERDLIVSGLVLTDGTLNMGLGIPSL